MPFPTNTPKRIRKQGGQVCDELCPCPTYPCHFFVLFFICRNEKSEDILQSLYKSASFVVQAIVFKETGNYVRQQRDLLQRVSFDEKVIVETFLTIKNSGIANFDEVSSTLLTWTKKWIEKTK